MSLLRRESPRKEQQRPLSTADMAGRGDEAMERPIIEAREDGAATRVQTPREERRTAEQRDARRTIEDVDASRAEAKGATRRADDIEDAVVKQDIEDAATKQEEPARAGGQVPKMAAESQRLAPLFNTGAAQGFRDRWDATQISFVDDPRHAVQQADQLVAEVMKSLAQSFADERSRLEAQMHGEQASTENLRVALQHYRSFFQRLLSL